MTKWIKVVFLTILLTRLPFIYPGYGLDPDAWRIVEVAYRFKETHSYIPSRLPGYPFS